MSMQDADIPTPTLAEDLLLVLFQPDSGTIAGETTLFYPLAGAVLSDLALQQKVTTSSRSGAVMVKPVEGQPPSDDIFASTWDYISTKPRSVQTVLAAIGPTLRGPLLARLVARGDLRAEKTKTLGLFTSTALRLGDNGRRAAVLARVRDALVDGADPSPRTAALAALLWKSGSLPQLHREIPWTSAVISRAQELERGQWGATAAGEAVARTLAAIVANSVIVTTAVTPPN
ncbi:Uncharacterised protein [Mycolicibacterium tokaiense]|uniref:GPP34 family phosphoprotein n=2 Tax=Mycolicibacterium tokaiense TaxID=39695 RepID=A0A378T9U1_9MYCO|nr:hypothetical protein MTOK_36550 [Mycolicibacterium tokaiense]STZ57608.1 Uncharacterised protein [Mycolicibacterium tokaiense]